MFVLLSSCQGNSFANAENLYLQIFHQMDLWDSLGLSTRQRKWRILFFGTKQMVCNNKYRSARTSHEQEERPIS